jgi:hypothetical protein
LDVTFNEDRNHTRKGFAAQNLAALRRLALNLLNLDPDKKRSKRRKRLKALLDDSFLLHSYSVFPWRPRAFALTKWLLLYDV